MIEKNEHEEDYVTEAKEVAKEQAAWFFEMIEERVNDLNMELDWYVKEVIKQIKLKAKEASE